MTDHGCDFEVNLPKTIFLKLRTSLEIFKCVDPVSIGMNLNVDQNPLYHPKLKMLLEENQHSVHQLIINISDDNQKSTTILNSVVKLGKHSWWESILDWSPTATRILNIMLHLIVLIFVCKIVTLFCMIGMLCAWLRLCKKMCMLRRCIKL